MASFIGPELPSGVSDLILSLDALNNKSYPGTGASLNDVSVTGATATLVNSPTYTAGYFTYNGTTQYAHIPYSAALSPTTAITVSVWAFQSNWSTSTENTRIASKTEGGGWNLGVGDPGYAGQVGFVIHMNGTYRAVGISKSSVSAGWHMLTGTCDGRYLNFYIDGVVVSTYDNTAYGPLTYNNTNNIIIASEAGGGTTNSIVGANYFAGPIGNLTMYNRALSTAEVLQCFQAMRDRYGI